MDHARSFLDCAKREADRLIEGDRFHDTEIAEAGHPRHLACVLRDRAYAQWLLTGELDRSSLEVSAGYQLEYVAEKTEDAKGRECQFAMTGILAAARSALCAGNLSYAAEILSDDLRFLWHHENERQFWHELIRRYPEYDDDFRDRFDAFFALVRDPEFKEEIDGIGTYILTTILRLETGIIRRMYVLGHGLTDPIPPELVIADISY